MLPQSKRLTRQEFSHAFSHGRRVHNSLMQLIVLGASDFKTAIVVPKKIHKSAVKRNKLKRQMYALLESHGDLKGRYIIIVKPAIKNVSYANLKESVQSLVGLHPHSR